MRPRRSGGASVVQDEGSVSGADVEARRTEDRPGARLQVRLASCRAARPGGRRESECPAAERAIEVAVPTLGNEHPVLAAHQVNPRLCRRGRGDVEGHDVAPVRSAIAVAIEVERVVERNRAGATRRAPATLVTATATAATWPAGEGRADDEDENDRRNECAFEERSCGVREEFHEGRVDLQLGPDERSGAWAARLTGRASPVALRPR